MSIEKLNVFIQFDGGKRPVGQLVKSGREIFFRYQVEFVQQGLELSPIKLPLKGDIVSSKAQGFDGLFGVFNDSLPDNWGRLLLDRKLASQGIALQNISALDRLAYTGSKGMGALVYEPEHAENDKVDAIDLDKLSEESSFIMGGNSSEIIEELFCLGGSSGGARPKIFVGFNPETEQMVAMNGKLLKGFEPWIIKFPSSMDMPDIGVIEYAYYEMSKQAGITMSDSRLLKGKSGKFYFATKRFDRIHNKRLHMHSAAGLMHDDYRYSTMDYGHLMDAAFQLQRHVKAYEKVFRLAAFNVYAHNRDDHSKNFAFLMDEKGAWQFAPAYDLTFSYSSHGHHSTLVAGESQNPGKEHLLKLAKHFGVDHASSIIDEVKAAVAQWDSIATHSGVSKESKQQVAKAINSLLKH